MRLTNKKKTANRNNAKKSTGPRTVEGKARSSRNATKHGLASQRLIVRDDERDEFFEFQKELRHRNQPIGATEEEIFRQLVRSAWNLRRIERLEDEEFNGSDDPLRDPELEEKMDRYIKYQAHWERSLYRAIKELRKLQTDRILKVRLPVQVVQLATDLVSTSELLKRSQNIKGYGLEINVYKAQKDALKRANAKNEEKAA